MLCISFIKFKHTADNHVFRENMQILAYHSSTFHTCTILDAFWVLSQQTLDIVSLLSVRFTGLICEVLVSQEARPKGIGQNLNLKLCTGIVNFTKQHAEVQDICCLCQEEIPSAKRIIIDQQVSNLGANWVAFQFDLRFTRFSIIFVNKICD